MFHILIFFVSFYSQTLFSSAKQAVHQTKNSLQEACDKAAYPGEIDTLSGLLKRSDFSIVDKNMQSAKLQQTLQWYEDNKQTPPASIVQALCLLFPNPKS